MKLFGSKKGDEKSGAGAEGDDYSGSPVETVSLTKPSAASHPPPAPEEEPRAAYGIDNAIELMRALPPGSEQNVELVVQVIKQTLESLQVRVPDIIDDASRKQKRLEERVAGLKQEIAEFEREIQVRKDEIGRLEADHAETSDVKARLELAERARQAQAEPQPAPGVIQAAK
jgi:hypothetical protein